MNTRSLTITYRPVRVGWCVRNDNFDDVRQAMRWTCALWGGAYNPIIPVGNMVSCASLIKRYRLDVLYPVVDDPALKAFVDLFPYLGWRDSTLRRNSFFEDLGAGLEPPFLDVRSTIRYTYDRHARGQEHDDPPASHITWHADDPLANIFLAQFGLYPSPDEAGFDYAAFVQGIFGAQSTVIAPGDAPPDPFEPLTPYNLSNTELLPDGSAGDAGLYIGDAGNFEDVVNFWNLRAANIDLFFFDPAHRTRLEALRDHYVNLIQNPTESSRHHPRMVTAWWRAGNPPNDLSGFGSAILYNDVPKFAVPITAPLMHSTPRSVLASVDDSREGPSVALQLPEKPFQSDNRLLGPKVIVGVHASQFGADLVQTLAVPFIPELNDHFRREMSMYPHDFRAQREGFGVMVAEGTTDLSFRALNVEALFVRLFDLFGIKAEPSPAGKVASRMIQQMGGLQGCRVFKLPGVRDLIEKYGPLRSFTRGAATKLIGRITTETKAVDFPTLYIQGVKLTPSSTFDYLLTKGVFRAGLELTCPNCNLDFWAALESIAHEVHCEYCGVKFQIALQLKDRDWRFRRSGLFGKDNHQEGAIPIALTLQQFESNIHNTLGLMIFSTSFKLSSGTTRIPSCETDLVLLVQDSTGHLSLALGECKSAGEKSTISEDDATNLSAVADALPRERVSTFIVFAKTAPFTAEETDCCRRASAKHMSRVIMLSDRELEPYHVYERTGKEFDIHASAVSLRHMADATPSIYFAPRPKKSTYSRA